MKAFKFQIALAVFSVGMLLAGTPACGETKNTRENLVMAAFIYNFAKFVQWPEDAFSHGDAPLVVTVLGKDPFGDILKTLNSKTVRGRPLEIRKSARLDDLTTSHILFISQSEQSRLSEIMAKIDGWPVLTVSDLRRFTQHEGCIQFFLSDSKIRFAINPQTAEQRGIRISSQLLRLAQAPKEIP